MLLKGIPYYKKPSVQGYLPQEVGWRILEEENRHHGRTSRVYPF